MKGLLRSVLVLMLFAFSFNALAQSYEEIMKELDRTVKMDKIIVQFAPTTSASTVQSILNTEGLTIEQQVPWPRVLYVSLNIPAENYEGLNSVLTKLLNHKEVAFANPILETVDHSGFAVLNEVIVKLNPEKITDKRWEEANMYGYKIKEKLKYLPHTYILETTSNALDLAIGLKTTGLFEYAEPDYLFNPIVSTNDALYNRQWNIHNDSTTTFKLGLHGTIGADMNVDSAWTITQGDSSIHIAVLDAGVDTLHPDLMGNLLPGYDATGQGSKGYPNTNKRENAHGTACSGIIVAKTDDSIGVAGVAPHCKVLPIRVFYYIDSLGQTNVPWSTAAWMANAIGYAWHTGNVDIMSNSWAVPDLLFSFIGDSNSINVVSDLITQVQTQGRGGLGIPMFFSSGNWDSSNTAINHVPLWPGRLRSAIAVNATSMCDEAKSYTSCDHEQWVGHFGDSLKISAPGVQVPTCDMHGGLGYGGGDYVTDFNGTSAACPNAAAVMALILSVRPDLSWGDAVRILYGTADQVGGYDYNTIKEFGNWSSELGYGRVNAYRAVITAQSYVGVAETPVISSEQNGLTIYPNPTNSVLNISYTATSASTVNIELYSADGKLIKQENKGVVSEGKHTETINLDSALPNGFYFGKLIQTNQAAVPFRFVIVR